jgi:glycosyltransferase involved in cell wall biosynthesis
MKDAPHPDRPPRHVALAHDWLTGMRGGERVLELLCRMFPDAPILTLIHNPAAVSDLINRHPIRTSWLQRVPGIARHYRPFLPLFPAAARSLHAPPADLFISTSHCVAKGMPAPAGARHLCYCFTPMRYAWVCPDAYFGRNPLARLLVRPLLAGLRRWDLAANARVDLFVAISRHVRQRIQTHYNRDARVVYPPVDTAFWTPAPGVAEPSRPGRDLGRYDLVVSALVPYKRIEVAIQAYTRSGFPLRIVGAGTEFQVLRNRAAPNVEFLGWLPDERVRDLYRNCRALIFPGEEDFGLVPLEAQACGRPVLALGRGGVLESVRDGLTGLFFPESTPDALLAAVARFEAAVWDPAAIRRHAETFGIPSFMNAFDACIQECLAAQRK